MYLETEAEEAGSATKALAPGSYSVQISQDQLDKLGFEADPPSRSLTIPEEGSFESGQDFILRKK